MEMQVEHDLAARGFVELLDRDALGIERSHRRACDLLRHLDDMGEIVGRDVEDVSSLALGNDQRMAGRTRHDVQERQGFIVLIDLVGRYFAAKHLGENVCILVGRHGFLHGRAGDCSRRR